jgi:hypothetical protein
MNVVVHNEYSTVREVTNRYRYQNKTKTPSTLTSVISVSGSQKSNGMRGETNFQEAFPPTGGLSVPSVTYATPREGGEFHHASRERYNNCTITDFDRIDPSSRSSIAIASQQADSCDTSFIPTSVGDDDAGTRAFLTARRRSHRPRGCRGGRKNRKNKAAAAAAVAVASDESHKQNEALLYSIGNNNLKLHETIPCSTHIASCVQSRQRQFQEASMIGLALPSSEVDHVRQLRNGNNKKAEQISAMGFGSSSHVPLSSSSMRYNDEKVSSSPSITGSNHLQPVKLEETVNVVKNTSKYGCYKVDPQQPLLPYQPTNNMPAVYYFSDRKGNGNSHEFRNKIEDQLTSISNKSNPFTGFDQEAQEPPLVAKQQLFNRRCLLRHQGLHESRREISQSSIATRHENHYLASETKHRLPLPDKVTNFRSYESSDKLTAHRYCLDRSASIQSEEIPDPNVQNCIGRSNQDSYSESCAEKSQHRGTDMSLPFKYRNYVWYSSNAPNEGGYIDTRGVKNMTFRNESAGQVASRQIEDSNYTPMYLTCENKDYFVTKEEIDCGKNLSPFRQVLTKQKQLSTQGNTNMDNTISQSLPDNTFELPAATKIDNSFDNSSLTSESTVEDYSSSVQQNVVRRPSLDSTDSVPSGSGNEYQCYNHQQSNQVLTMSNRGSLFVTSPRSFLFGGFSSAKSYHFGCSKT